jgi:hypothetical protein
MAESPDISDEELIPTGEDFKEIEQRLNVLELRKSGVSVEMIAVALRLPVPHIKKLLKKSYKQLARLEMDSTKEVRALTHARLETMLGAIWQDVIKGIYPAIREARTIVKDMRELHAVDKELKATMDSKYEVVFSHNWEQGEYAPPPPVPEENRVPE